MRHVLKFYMVFFVVLNPIFVFSEKVDIKNSGMEIALSGASGKISHGEESVPESWTFSKKKDGVCRAWSSANGGWAVELKSGSLKQEKLSAPVLGSDNRTVDPNNYHGLLTLDLLGYGVKAPCKYSLEIRDRYGREKLFSFSGKVVRSAKKNPAIDWSIKSTSSIEHRDFAGSNALDGDPKTLWRSRDSKLGGEGNFIMLDLGREQVVYGISYLPRQDRENLGRIKKYEVYVSKDNSVWRRKAVARGIFPKGSGKQVVKFSKPSTGRFVTLVCLESYSGRAGAAVAEFGAITSSSQQDGVPTSQRICRLIPNEVLSKLDSFSLVLTVKGPGSVVIDDVSLYWLPIVPKVFGSPNKEAGPDVVAAGLFGFDGYSFHMHSPLPVSRVRKNSPAEKAGLKVGDIIIGVNDVVFPETDCNPGWNWLANGHEPVLGRAALKALSTRRSSKRKTAQVYLNVVSSQHQEQRRLRLDIEPVGRFSKLFPLKMDSLGKAVYDDIIGFLVKHQRSDGSFCDKFGGRPAISTSLGAMALLGTKNKKYLPQVRKAVDWVISKYETGKGMGFWDMAYCGTFLCEWFYATGDKQVLPWIDVTLDWLPTVMHKSKWDTMIWGHGADGIPYGEKSLIAPTAHMEIFAALAFKCCGIKNSIWKLAEPYIDFTWSNPANGGHGAMGYNGSLRDTGQAWSRTGNIATAVSILGIRDDYQKGMLGYMKNYYPVMRNSHAYGYPGAQWGLIGLHNIDRKAFVEVMQEWTWDFALAWEPGFGLRFSQPHMGAPYMGEEAIVNPAYGTLLSVVNKGLYMTGCRTRFWAKAK